MIQIERLGSGAGVELRSRIGFELLVNGNTWMSTPIIDHDASSVTVAHAPSATPTKIRYLWYSNPVRILPALLLEVFQIVVVMAKNIIMAVIAVMFYSDVPWHPSLCSIYFVIITSLRWLRDSTRACATRAPHPLPPRCCTTLPPTSSLTNGLNLLLVFWQCGKMEFGCAVYVGVRPLGNWSGETDFLPLGPFIADL